MQICALRLDLPLDKKTVENQDWATGPPGPSRAAGRRAVVGRGPRAAGPWRAVGRGPPGLRAAGPLGCGGPWAAGRWAAGLLLAKPMVFDIFFYCVTMKTIWSLPLSNIANTLTIITARWKAFPTGWKTFNAFLTYLLCRVFANRVTCRLTHPTDLFRDLWELCYNCSERDKNTSAIWRSIVVSSSRRISCENWKLIVYDVDMGSYERRWPNHGTWTRGNSRDEKAMRWTQAYSTMLGAHRRWLFYKRTWRIDSVMEVDTRVSEKSWNGEGNLDWTGMLLKEDSQG